MYFYITSCWFIQQIFKQDGLLNFYLICNKLILKTSLHTVALISQKLQAFLITLQGLHYRLRPRVSNKTRTAVPHRVQEPVHHCERGAVCNCERATVLNCLRAAVLPCLWAAVHNWVWHAVPDSLWHCQRGGLSDQVCQCYKYSYFHFTPTLALF